MIWAQLGMELCLGYLALGLAWIGFAGGAWPPPPVTLVPALVGLASARLFPDAWRRHGWFEWLRWIVAFGWAAGCAIWAQQWGGASPVAGWNVAFMAGLLVFWRGWSLGEDGVDPRDVLGTVQVATLGALALVAIMHPIARGAGLLPGVGTLLFGLLALGLARRAERRRPGAPRESDWLSLVAILGVAILVVGGLLLLLVTPDALATLLAQMQMLGALALAPITALFGWLASLLGGGGQGQLPPSAPAGVAPSPPFGDPNPDRPSGMDDLWVTILTTVVPILLIVFLFFVVVLPLLKRASQLRPQRTAEVPVEREPGPPVSSADRFSWRMWWQALLARLFGSFREEALPDDEREDGGRRGQARDGRASAPEPRTIRELYRTLLKSAAREGHSRAATATPHEFTGRLSAARPDARRPLADLTEIYTRTRYGEERPDGEDVARMRSSVDEVIEELKRTPSDDRRG